MNRLLKRLAILVAGLAMVACVDAAGEPDLGAVKAELSKKFVGRTIQSVRTTPLKGLYEVVMEPREIVYTDSHGDYLFLGDMVDFKRRISLTEERMRELSRTDFSKLPFDESFKIVKGKGTRKLAIFSDPDCPYCKKIERDTLAKIDDVTIYVFLLPLTSLHPDSARKASLLWCAQDKPKAWQEWMFEGKLPANDGSCVTPIQPVLQFAQKLGVTATPTLVFESGDVSAGAMEAGELETMLAAKKP